MFKSLVHIIKDLDVSRREVTFMFAKFDEYDSDNDIIEKGAFKKTIQEVGPKGANRIKHLYNHQKDTLPPIGVVKDMWEDGEAAYAKSELLENVWGEAILEAYQKGGIDEHSFWGLSPKNSVSYNDRGGKVIKEVKLMEVSTVLWGANQNSKLININKSELVDFSDEPTYLRKLSEIIKGYEPSKENFESISNELIKAAEILESLEKSSRRDTLDNNKPKPVLTLAEIWQLKNL